MDWAKFGYAVAGGLFGGLLTQLAAVVRFWWTKRDTARFTALMLALVLEDYADRCFGTFTEYQGYDPSRTPDEPDTDVPGLPAYDADTNWRSLGIRLTSDAMDFRVKVDAAHGYLRASWMDGGPSMAWSDAADRAVELGVAALAIADDMRKSFKLKQAESRGYDLSGLLREELVKMERRRVEWMASHSEIFGGGGNA